MATGRLPETDGTFLDLTSPQTAINKTLTAPTVNGGTISDAAIATATANAFANNDLSLAQVMGAI